MKIAVQQFPVLSLGKNLECLLYILFVYTIHAATHSCALHVLLLAIA